ncbi:MULTISPECIES: hypothetical protein [unclassified Cupriavidus]|uniref:hypothetical protein n=1 Tax=unclassified Cupriavidus TaxID=2640874 RepID=UPI0010F53F42|nr:MULTISPECIES: hypothetical protein [unclassified Cupriavidus]MWL92011.1 hypothetical protein [Cupriavidus sp. SW-Y-13]
MVESTAIKCGERDAEEARFSFSGPSLALLILNCVVFGSCVAGIFFNAASRNPAAILASLIGMAGSAFVVILTVWRTRVR